MRVAIASDHAGFIQKQPLVDFMTNEMGIEVVDLGPETEDRVDYPDYAEKVARMVASGEVDRGVLVCGTGIGMAIAADKIAGVRASSITTPDFADLFRRHNDGNVVCLSGRFVDVDVNKDINKVFLTSEFEGGRHAQRVAKMMKLDSTGKTLEGQKPRVMPLNR